MHKKLEEHFKEADDVVFFHLQTVWEGTHTNTPERGPKEAEKYGITVPVGFDGHVDGGRTSTFMQRLGTGGTPWTVVMDKRRKIRLNEVTPADAAAFIQSIEKMRRGS
ncbi:MAG: hypothetical protein HC813_01810 [Planctomycetes bacterium]|nr:hypothetical protein [Planctomycetota bacterium]